MTTTWASSFLAVATLLAAAAASAQSNSPLLVYYDFETTEPSGPDTFRLFEQPGGGVDLSYAFHRSGTQSLRLREGQGDGSFSEFLGFFQERREGLVYVQFYILFADPNETFNFALAGPRWFLHFGKDGHAFWLTTNGGTLQHRPGGKWQPLVAPRPFSWYFVDLVYDVSAGSYDLALYEEGEEAPVIDLRRQRNTADADRSSVAYYSFIGDLEDQEEVQFFVDDLVVATDPEVLLEPFVAPGRRRFFVEYYAAAWEPLTNEEREGVLVEARLLLRNPPASLDDHSAENLDRLERAADEAFLARDLDLAEELYLLLASQPGRESRVLLKMADVYFLRDDLESEKSARERIFGGLRVGEEVKE